MKLTKSIMLATLAAAIAFPVAAFAAKGGGKKKKDQAAVATFESADLNSNGSVSQAEYVTAMKTTLGEDGAKTKFASLDKNDDKKLSKEEYDAGSAPAGKKRKKKSAN